jgi:translation initiation factor 2D
VLREKFLARMQPQVVVQRGGTRAVRKGALPLVHVSAEKRQGNKRVTRVAGLEAYLVDVEACAAELRSKLACSTSVSELPGKNNPGHEVLVQGGVVDRVAEHLVGVYGIPKKSILTKTV